VRIPNKSAFPFHLWFLHRLFGFRGNDVALQMDASEMIHTANTIHLLAQQL